MVNKPQPGRTLERIFFYLLIGFICLICIFPVAWMVIESLKTPAELMGYPPTLIPQNPTLEAYTKLMTVQLFPDMGFNQWVINSLIVAVVTTSVSITLASLAAYAMSRFRFRGSQTFRYTILVTQMLPGALMILPLYLIMRDLSLLDSLAGLILCYITYTLPYSAYMLRGYIDTIPPDLDEMAMIDGCTRLGALFRIVFPLAGPGIAVTTVFTFIHSWNEFLFALVMINSFKNWTIPVALAMFRSSQFGVDWAFMFAGAFVVSLPVLVVFIILQKYIVGGMTAGAVKG